MSKLTTHERVKRIFEHRLADRIPIADGPWPSTIERWVREGMPAGVDYVDYFDLDHIGRFAVDVSPRYEEKVLEETEEYKIFTSAYGVTFKQWKHAASTPDFLDFTIISPEAWRQAKARMTPTTDRIPWQTLKADYPRWREQGAWIQGVFWFGFDVTHSWAVGTERLLMAMVEDPEWVMDIFNHYLDMNIALYDQLWDAGYTFDSVFWYDDMGFKGKQFFSLPMYRELLKPVHQRAIDWAHAKGIKAHLHSCGDVSPFIPEWIEMGVDALNPLEVKAGIDPVKLKKQYGNQLVLHGGINAVLWDQPEKIEAELTKAIPALKENGGYIFASDHSIPSSVSLEDFRRIVQRVKMLGSYE